MDGARSKAVLPLKRDAIVMRDDQEPTKEQPKVKSVKRGAESVPSSEVAELQREVAKWRDNYQRSCKRTKTAETRVEFLENLFDTMREEKDGGIVVKLNDLAQENAALKNEMAQMKKEHNKQIYELTRKLAKYEEGSHENEALQNGMAKMKKEHNKQMANLITRASDSKMKDREIIDELTRKLAKYEEGTNDVWLPMKHQTALFPREGAATTAINVSPPEQVASLDNPPNIFQLCNPDSLDAVPYENARAVIGPLSSQYVGLWFARFPQLQELILKCEACEKSLPKNQIIPHFLSKGHYTKIRVRCAAVSRAAFEYWVDKLQPEPAAQPMLQLQPVSAACTADPNASVNERGVKKE